MYGSISFGIGLQVFVYNDALIKCLNEPCTHSVVCAVSVWRGGRLVARAPCCLFKMRH